MHPYEAHLSVADTGVAQAFYTGVVGLQFAYRDLRRDVIFLWAGKYRRSMLGFWGPTTTYGGNFHESHLAFRFSLAELLAAGRRLRSSGVMSQDFGAEQTDEPSVIGWMPSAQLYFHDPDGHLVEFIALLNDTPDPSFIGSLSEWRKRPNQRCSQPLTGVRLHFPMTKTVSFKPSSISPAAADLVSR